MNQDSLSSTQLMTFRSFLEGSIQQTTAHSQYMQIRQGLLQPDLSCCRLRYENDEICSIRKSPVHREFWETVTGTLSCWRRAVDILSTGMVKRGNVSPLADFRSRVAQTLRGLSKTMRREAMGGLRTGLMIVEKALGFCEERRQRMAVERMAEFGRKADRYYGGTDLVFERTATILLRALFDRHTRCRVENLLVIPSAKARSDFLSLFSTVGIVVPDFPLFKRMVVEAFALSLDSPIKACGVMAAHEVLKRIMSEHKRDELLGRVLRGQENSTSLHEALAASILETDVKTLRELRIFAQRVTVEQITRNGAHGATPATAHEERPFRAIAPVVSWSLEVSSLGCSGASALAKANGDIEAPQHARGSDAPFESNPLLSSPCHGLATTPLVLDDRHETTQDSVPMDERYPAESPSGHTGGDSSDSRDDAIPAPPKASVADEDIVAALSSRDPTDQSNGVLSTEGVIDNLKVTLSSSGDSNDTISTTRIGQRKVSVQGGADRSNSTPSSSLAVHGAMVQSVTIGERERTPKPRPAVVVNEKVESTLVSLYDGLAPADIDRHKTTSDPPRNDIPGAHVTPILVSPSNCRCLPTAKGQQMVARVFSQGDGMFAVQTSYCLKRLNHSKLVTFRG